MIWTPTIKKILAIEDLDIQILEALPVAKSLQEIAKETKIPRTSVAYTLKNLHKRGFVEVSRHGKRSRYIALSPAKLSEYIQKAHDEIYVSSTEKKGVRVKPTKEDEFIVHVGLNEIVPAYARIAAENKHERVMGLQHHKSYRDIVEKAPPELLTEFNSTVKLNSIIVDGILNEGAYRDYAREIKANPEKYAGAVESLNDRSADYHTYPDTLFNFHSELWLFKSTALFINWQDEVAIEITNKEIKGFIADMFGFVKSGSRRIDHNAEMRKILGGLAEGV